MNYDKEKYLKLLSKEYKNIREVSEEIINLQAILNLPKGTEVFLSDLHGEYEPFVHILNSGAGIIRSKLDLLLETTVVASERNTLATLIYYPEEKLKSIKTRVNNLKEWYEITLYRLIEVCKKVSSKYTRSKVRKALPKELDYIIDELLNSQATDSDKDKKVYYGEIIKTIIDIDMADEFIIAISNLIKRMAIDHLHIVGDIYDRGMHPDLVIETLMNFHSLDIQWGNHDILWMGAASGNKVSIASVIRNCARYDNISILEDVYGINIRPLSTFALETYKDDDCKCFRPKIFDYNKYGNRDKNVISKIHKAITMIQFKLEGQWILKHPEYKSKERLLLDKINYKNKTININGKTYELKDTNFPTVNPENPYELTNDEEELIERLQESFTRSEVLNKHIKFIYSKGSSYMTFNSNLLFHGCIPMEENGEFTEMEVLGKKVKGKAYLDYIDEIVKKAYFDKDAQEEKDFMWYLWSCKNSPFFGKDRMTVFEQYFIDDKDVKHENKNPYYKIVETEEGCIKILKEFGITDPESHIINGHIPVKAKDGESPVRANGRYLVIDGGFAKSYRERTGEAGYTLTYNSYGLLLSANKPFTSIIDAIENESDIKSEIVVKAQGVTRKTVGDTDIGTRLKQEVEDLRELLEAYRTGEIKEKL